MESHQLSGTLPTELGLFTRAQQMQLYDNSLSGTIPSELNKLVEDPMAVCHLTYAQCVADGTCAAGPDTNVFSCPYPDLASKSTSGWKEKGSVFNHRWGSGF